MGSEDLRDRQSVSRARHLVRRSGLTDAYKSGFSCILILVPGMKVRTALLHALTHRYTRPDEVTVLKVL